MSTSSSTPNDHPALSASVADPVDPPGADPDLDPLAPKPIGQGLVVWWLAVFGIGTLLFLYRYLAVVADGHAVDPFRILVQEYVAALGAGLLFFPLRRLVRRWPPSWPRVPAYVATILFFSFLHTTWNWWVRILVYQLLGFGSYDYGYMPVRYLMELPLDVLSITLMTLAVIGWDSLQRARARQLRAMRLESRLAKAQVHNLRLQLQPHFLFNALNTISATLYRNPGAADEMIDRLAALLRASLDTSEADEVPLAAELELLQGYLSIMHARFGDRLRVELEVEGGLGGAQVPSLLLQPLVENAVRHGNAEKVGQGRVWICLRRCNEAEQPQAEEALEILVEDDGPGIAADKNPLEGGIGLSTTVERLQLLYGRGQVFEAGNRPEGGFRVCVRLPYRTSARVETRP